MASKRPVSQPKSYSIFFTLVVCSLLITSCGLPASSPANVNTPLPPSPTPLMGLASPTSIPPSPTLQITLDTPTFTPTASDTPTLVPTSTPAGTATPLIPTGSFALAPGTTAGTITGTVQPGQVVTHTIGAGQSQPMTLILDSKKGGVTLGVSEQNGNVLLDPALKQTAWQMALPSTQLYTIQVIGGATADDYTLTVKLPQMVALASGTTSTTLTGKTVKGYLYSYALNLSTGQTLTASLNLPSGTAFIDIYGISSGTLLNASAAANTWTGILPLTEAYVIEVVPTNGQVVDYSLTLSVTAAAANSYYNITFEPGTTAAVLRGMLQPGQVVTYSIQAGKAQPLILLVESPNTDVTLGVFEADGTMLLDPAKKWSYWQSQLPKTGVYTIRVIGGATAEKFILTVKLGRLVYFPAGSSSVTLRGNTYPGYVVSYAFRLSAGMTLTVRLDEPTSQAFIDIFGIATGSLLSYKEGATEWTGTLPETQEYVIEVIPRHGASVAFSLTVSIP